MKSIILDKEKYDLALQEIKINLVKKLTTKKKNFYIIQGQSFDIQKAQQARNLIIIGSRTKKLQLKLEYVRRNLFILGPNIDFYTYKVGGSVEICNGLYHTDFFNKKLSPIIRIKLINNNIIIRDGFLSDRQKNWYLKTSIIPNAFAIGSTAKLRIRHVKGAFRSSPKLKIGYLKANNV